jgi:hypothetical protein
MELASMLAGEPFSDDPDCACPVISAYMRTWNDGLPYAERQKLKPYAARAVGTRAGGDTTRRRIERSLELSGARFEGRGRLARAGERVRWRLRIAAGIGVASSLRLRNGAPVYAARLALAQGGNARAAEVMDELIAVGGRVEALEPATLALTVAGLSDRGVAERARQLPVDPHRANQGNGAQPGRDRRGHQDLRGRETANGREEHVEDDQARHQAPDEEADVAGHSFGSVSPSGTGQKKAITPR